MMPSAGDGHKNRPRSNFFVNRQAPWPSCQITFSTLPLRPLKQKRWPFRGSCRRTSCTCRERPGNPRRLCGAPHKRRGIDGLSAMVTAVMKEAPGSGAVFGFRGKRADRIKLLWWDGQGFCLFYKVLERGYFPWPTAKDGVAHLTQAQMSMLVEGIDWRRPAWTSAPARTG